MPPAAPLTAHSFVIQRAQDLPEARAAVSRAVATIDLELVDAAELVASELITNALLHGGGRATVTIQPTDIGLRVVVADTERRAPVLGVASDSSMTGRGLRLVGSLAHNWGVEPTEDGKAVWVEVTRRAAARTAEELLAAWDEPLEPRANEPQRITVSLGDVPTGLLLRAKAHVDNLVREFALAAGSASAPPPHLAELIDTVVTRFAEPRDAIKRQAIEAFRLGRRHTRLVLHLTADAAAAGEAYLEALDEVDVYCRAMRLLTLETPPEHRVFRRWYIEELVKQVRNAEAGIVIEEPMTFEERLLSEIAEVESAWRTSDRAARFYAVVGALGGAVTPADVADVVLDEGLTALGASGGGLVLAGVDDRLTVPGTRGYDDDVVQALRAERVDADLPAAVALRTGEAIWLESREECAARFPALSQIEVGTSAMCALPLVVRGRRLGALRFSFAEPRLFGDEEKSFAHALAAQCAQALDRSQLETERRELSHRFQRSLLPSEIPDLPWLQVAAAYHPLGTGMELGGDFYDVWALDDETVAVAIGDVAGTGPEAAAMSALLRFTLRALLMTDRSPEHAVARLNDALLMGGATEERFCTAVVGIISLRPSPRIELAGGGHPPPLLRRTSGAVEELAVGGGLLGAFPTVEVDACTVELFPGDVLVFYTDGVIEARSPQGRFFEVDGVSAVLEATPSAAEVTGVLEDAVMAHVAGDIGDDMAILAVEVRAEAGSGQNGS